MSESKVPLPEPLIKGWELAECSYALWDEDQMRSYGDARAAEARRLALLEAIAICEKEGDGWVDHTSKLVGYHCAHKLRALADNASPKQVSG